MATIAFSEANHQRIRELSVWKRWQRGLAAILEVGKNPDRTDKVLEGYEHLNIGSEVWRARRFYSSPDAGRLHAEDRTLDGTTINFEALAALPEGTLGRTYAEFMRARNLTPDIFTAESGTFTRESYLVKRLRQTHDLWHVLTGIETDVPGELELQAFTFAQLWIPSAFVLVLMGSVRWFFTSPTLPFRVLRGAWRGARTGQLAPLPWEDFWAMPLRELRKSLGTPPRRSPGSAVPNPDIR
jgi:ubiquinone biosynthesis protein COQ4